jgi:DNA-binding protein YbaB
VSTEITGSARRGGVAVEVHPGGALSSITVSERDLALGGRALAAAILAAVADATAVANQRTKHALHDALSAVGLDSLDAGVVERAESTTPDTWRI